MLAFDVLTGCGSTRCGGMAAPMLAACCRSNVCCNSSSSMGGSSQAASCEPATKYDLVLGSDKPCISWCVVCRPQRAARQPEGPLPHSCHDGTTGTEAPLLDSELLLTL
jgi:hypothetical protein